MAVTIRNHNVTGNLVADPEKIKTPAGDDLTVFKLAENRRYLNRETNEWQDADPNFYSVGISNPRLGENVLASLKKGDHVKVSGDLQPVPFTYNNGEAGMNNRIFADDVAPSLQWHTATPQADARAQARSAAAAPSAAAQEPAASERVDTWPVTEPGTGGMSR